MKNRVDSSLSPNHPGAKYSSYSEARHLIKTIRQTAATTFAPSLLSSILLLWFNTSMCMVYTSITWDDVNNRTNCTRTIWRTGWIHPFLQIILVQNSYSEARNLINTICQTAATTFAPSLLSLILLLWFNTCMFMVYISITCVTRFQEFFL